MEASRLLRTTFQYGLISFSISSFFCILLPYFFQNYFNEDTWTIAKEIVHILSMTLLIAIANYWYSAEMGFIQLDLQGFLKMLSFTLALGTILVFLIITVKSNQALKKNLQNALQMNQQLERSSAESVVKSKSIDTLTLPSEVEKQQLSLDSSKLIYLTSTGNYLDCIYLDSSDQLQTHRLRNRMKVMEEILQKHQNFFRCHRAFIVNTTYIQSVEGNAKGYQLSLRHVASTIPVARSKSPHLQAILT